MEKNRTAQSTAFSHCLILLLLYRACEQTLHSGLGFESVVTPARLVRGGTLNAVTVVKYYPLGSQDKHICAMLLSTK